MRISNALLYHTAIIYLVLVFSFISNAEAMSCQKLLTAAETNIPLAIQNVINQGDLIKVTGERVQKLISNYPLEDYFIIGWGRTTTLEAALMNLELGNEYDLSYRQINASLASARVTPKFTDLFISPSASSRSLVITRNLNGGMTWPRLVPDLLQKLREINRHELIMDFTMGSSALSWQNISPQKFGEEQAIEMLGYLKRAELSSVQLTFEIYSEGNLIYEQELNSEPSDESVFKLSVKIDLDNDYNSSTIDISNELEPYATSTLFMPQDLGRLETLQITQPRSEFFDLVRFLNENRGE